ncbi:hypothetical protein Syun_028474 [Stephania yunnanensis]|uniref:Uncharacterized protein n=1 Tax=Stephania yunnanensis TaxID=152371 RepID=A0AAP0EPT3_9MAGN
MEEEKEEAKKKMRGAMAMAESQSQSQSLGWLTESSIMPKKHKAINGVGASSILQLKAQLYKSQEEAKSSKPPSSSSDDLPYRSVAKHKPPLRHDLFSHKNSGVDSRAHKDKLELKALQDGSLSYAALEKKAELYDKLVRGELSDEEEKEKYSVDFFRKGLEEDQSEQSTRRSDSYSEILQENESDDTAELFDAKLEGPGQTAAGVDKDEYKRFVREVHEEASQAREKASALKLRREEQAAARREKLKQAYLKKRLESLKAAEKKNGP